ncbi:hypothetical protein [Bacillus kwashiorkori]|uniref:hypothetical protein n=1 Tax=Bacillus kwashiorkori TaxID=1522318 RepID=UPI00078480C5|nr:hypothetical protein [Bacillus kwashiorkori]
MSKKLLNSSEGVTLVELLASILIISIIGIVTYSILFTGIKANERIKVEATLRNEADYILSHFINEFFVLKASEIVAEHLPEQDDRSNYYLEIKNKGLLGFKDSNVYLNNEVLMLSNNDISMEGSKIQKNGDLYEIHLVLKSKKTSEVIELESIFSIINDRKEENDEG